MRRIAIGLLVLLVSASPAWGAGQTPVKPSARDKCPVCGMFVAKYPDFVAEVIFRDGAYAVFDGAKDMFKYYFNLKRYAPARAYGDIAAIYVTDYYRLELTDAVSAWYVVGSDVFGPMGKELVPFAKETDAREFMKDHRGKSLLRFKDVRGELIRGLD